MVHPGRGDQGLLDTPLVGGVVTEIQTLINKNTNNYLRVNKYKARLGGMLSVNHDIDLIVKCQI